MTTTSKLEQREKLRKEIKKLQAEKQTIDQQLKQMVKMVKEIEVSLGK